MQKKEKTVNSNQFKYTNYRCAMCRTRKKLPNNVYEEEAQSKIAIKEFGDYNWQKQREETKTGNFWDKLCLINHNINAFCR